jgi:hypothetical protein
MLILGKEGVPEKPPPGILLKFLQLLDARQPGENPPAKLFRLPLLFKEGIEGWFLENCDYPRALNPWSVAPSCQGAIPVK